jgi:hypothetical protein
MSDVLLTLLKVVFYLLAVVSFVGWVWLIRRKVVAGLPIIEPRPRTEPFWSLAEFFLCFGLWLVCTTAASLTARRLAGVPLPGASDLAAKTADSTLTTPEELVAILVAASIANAVVLLCMLVQMGLTNRKVMIEYGLGLTEATSAWGRSRRCLSCHRPFCFLNGSTNSCRMNTRFLTSSNRTRR